MAYHVIRKVAQSHVSAFPPAPAVGIRFLPGMECDEAEELEFPRSQEQQAKVVHSGDLFQACGQICGRYLPAKIRLLLGTI